jgi:hypothetical protein
MKIIIQPAKSRNIGYNILINFCLLVLIIITSTTFWPTYSTADEFTPSQIKNYRMGHPRLLALEKDINRVRELVLKDPDASSLYTEMKRAADELRDVPPVSYPENGNALSSARIMLGRTYLLGLLSRLSETKESRQNYTAEAWRQILPAINSKTWSPKGTPFLCVGETLHALAIAYDWLYQDLSSFQRELLEASIINKGLKPYLESMDSGENWTKKEGNWAFVCSGGALIGALSIAESNPDISERVLLKALPAISDAMKIYYPDGAWWEGLAYWGYATRYAVYSLSALTTAYGHDFGLSTAPGFQTTGLFPVYLTGPSGIVFNFGDCEGRSKTPDMCALFWLSQKFKNPLYAWYNREYFLLPFIAKLKEAEKVIPIIDKYAAPYALNLLWYSSEGRPELRDAIPTNKTLHGENIEIAAIREGWRTSDVFLAIKGGKNNKGHSHLDLGSFVLDIGGYRWAMDLGKDDYSLPGYWDYKPGGGRSRIYRLLTADHNTLLINNQAQNNGATSYLNEDTNFSDPKVTIDITDAYRSQGIKKVVRDFLYIKKEQKIVISDSLISSSPLSVEWSMLTEANVTIDKNRAILRQADHSITLFAAEPIEAKFNSEPATPGKIPFGQSANTGVTRLFLSLPNLPPKAKIRVEFNWLKSP